MSGFVSALERVRSIGARFLEARTVVAGGFPELLARAVALQANSRTAAGFRVDVVTAGRPSDLLPGTRPYGLSTSGPPLPEGLTNELVEWRGVILHPLAMRSFQEASRILGAPIAVTDSYRSPEQQLALYQEKPGLAAPPGSSYHERGLAIDVDGDAYGGYDSPAYRRVVEVLERLGWVRFDPVREPWHFSWRVEG